MYYISIDSDFWVPKNVIKKLNNFDFEKWGYSFLIQKGMHFLKNGIRLARNKTINIYLEFFRIHVQCLPPNSYNKNFKKPRYTVTIWRIIEFSSVCSWQFLKISQKIAKRNYLVCNYLVVGTVYFLIF